MTVGLKAVSAAVIGLLIVLVQYVSNVYAGGLDGLEWLGAAAIVLGPAGFVAIVQNTSWNPAAKAFAQQVSVVAVVVIQGVQNVYTGGMSTQDWLGVALILLTSLGVYVVPDTSGGRGPVFIRQS